MISRGATLTLAQLVRVGQEYLPEGLVARPVEDALGHVEVEFAPCFSYGCFEVRLDGDSRVDLLACALRDDGGAKALRRCLPSENTSAGRLLHWWAHSRAAAPVEAIWIELDRPSDVGSAPPPFAYLRFEPGVLSADVRAAAKVLGCTKHSARALESAMAGLDPGEQVLHLATMPHRDGGVRLRVHLGLRPARVLPYLDRIGWAGPTGRVADLLTAWPAGLPLGVQLDLTARVELPIHLELYLPRSPAVDARWAPFLERVGPFVDAKRLALAASWPSDSNDAPHASHWPMQVERRLQLKTSVDPSGGVRVKAYLGFSPRLALA